MFFPDFVLLKISQAKQWLQMPSRALLVAAWALQYRRGLVNSLWRKHEARAHVCEATDVDDVRLQNGEFLREHACTEPALKQSSKTVFARADVYSKDQLLWESYRNWLVYLRFYNAVLKWTALSALCLRSHEWSVYIWYTTPSDSLRHLLSAHEAKTFRFIFHIKAVFALNMIG